MIKCIEKIKLESINNENADYKRKIASNNTDSNKKFEYASKVFANKKRQLEMAKKNKKN